MFVPQNRPASPAPPILPEGEWKDVWTLFQSRTPPALRLAARPSKKLGNRLAGHEPHEREVLFSAPAFAIVHPGVGATGKETGGRANVEHVEMVRHQLYAKGSADDLTLALKIATQE